MGTSATYNDQEGSPVPSENSIPLTPDDARRLADALVRRRVELGYRSARALSTAINMDPRTITSLESARKTRVSRNTLAALEIAMKWDPGYINALIDSGQASRAWPQEQRVYLTTTSVSDDELAVARSVAQAAFDSTLASLRAGVRPQ